MKKNDDLDHKKQAVSHDYLEGSRMFPIFIDLNGYKVTVIGGGKIAARRIRTLIEGQFGTEIKIISPRLSPELEEFLAERDIKCSRLSWIESVYDERFLEDSDIVLACTSDEAVNRRIYEDCHKKNIKVNVSSDKTLCDFYFPSVIIEDDIVIAFNGSGKNHKGVKAMRQLVESWLTNDRHGI